MMVKKARACLEGSGLAEFYMDSCMLCINKLTVSFLIHILKFHFVELNNIEV